MGEESHVVTFTDWGPSVFRVDTVETTTDPNSKLPYSLITWLVIAALIILCLCNPFIRIISIFNRHCRFMRFFRSSSTLCPSIPHQDPPHTTDDVEEKPAVLMEEYWKGLEDKLEVVDKKKVKEKKDLSDILQRIRESSAVKAKEAHRLDQEFVEDQ